MRFIERYNVYCLIALSLLAVSPWRYKDGFYLHPTMWRMQGPRNVRTVG